MYIVTGNDPTFNIALWGPSGVGKTWLAATAQDHPAMADVMIQDIEGGLITVAYRGDIRANRIIAIEKFKPSPSMPVLPENCSTLEDEFWKLANKSPGYENIKTTIIDSGTECQTLNLQAIVSNSLANKKQPNRDADDIYIEDYGKSTAQLKRLFRWYRDLPINVIITALPNVIYPKGPDGKVKQNAEPISIQPWFTAKLSDAFRGYMDMVWYMFEENGERYLMTRETGIYKGKTRGMKFSKAIGGKVLLKNENDPDSKGHTLASLYDLYLETELPHLQK